MKPIAIAQRLRPFSHRPGASCLLPGTWWSVQAFPTRLIFRHKDKNLICDLYVTGPVALFTMEQDLERGVVRVFGEAKEGYFRLRLFATAEALCLCAERTPPQGLETSWGRLEPKGLLSLPMEWTFLPPSHRERFSLGCHKAQEWEKVVYRGDSREMIPHLLSLAQQIPPAPLADPLSFLHAEAIELFFRVHFRDLFIPRLIDEQHQGVPLHSLPLDSEPCALLYAAAQTIRSLFIKFEGSSLFLLPHIPSKWDCGRLTDISLGSLGSLDFEWSKFSLRRAAFRAAASGEISVHLPQGLKGFRLRTNLREKGIYQKTEQAFMVKAGVRYLLDRFHA